MGGNMTNMYGGVDLMNKNVKPAGDWSWGGDSIGWVV